MAAPGLKGFAVLLALLPVLAAAELPAPVRAELTRLRLEPGGLGVWVQAVDAERPLLAHNADTPRNPASTIKLLTTEVGLEQLGPDYTWKTEAYLAGPLRDGRLQGDLVLKGYGDPFLTPEAFGLLLRGLRDRGLRQIGGDLVLDRSFFAPPDEDPGAFDGEPHRAYNAVPDALLVNFQTLGFTLMPGDGSRVRIAVHPAPANLRIDNRLALTRGRCRLDRLSVTIDSPEVRFGGRYPARCGETLLYRLVLPPAELAYGVFRNRWRELGGSLDGGWRNGPMPAGARLLHTLRSRPLAELIRGMNKYSNNVMTRQLLLTLGAERFGPPGTEGKGRVAVREWLERQGLDFAELRLDNGAGLSRSTRISARSLGRLLGHVWHSRYRPELLASLPLSGIDGTLRRRFRGKPLAGRGRFKTGTLDDVRALAGYLHSRAGRDYIVVMLHNAPGVHLGKGTAVQDALLGWLFEQ